jgi:alpha-L-fucosidase 2
MVRFTCLESLHSVLTPICPRADISALYGDPAYYYYGNYETLGNLTVNIAGVSKYTSYNRALDLETGIHTTEFKANGAKFTM